MADLKNYVEGQEIEPYGRPRVYMGLEELNELKAYRDFGTLAQIRVLNDRYHELINRPSEQEIRNKAIDDFAEKISLEISESIIWDMLATMSKNGSLSDTSDKIIDYVIDTAKKVAEQMKGGAE